ncbi:hypothetical protein K1S49_22130, partial [Klebsiella pneumoniae]|nr:hypothetical protein [Klebsiella pneumoniae]
IRCVCGKKIGPDPRNFNQRVSLGRNDLLIRTFLSEKKLGSLKPPDLFKPRLRLFLRLGSMASSERPIDFAPLVTKFTCRKYPRSIPKKSKRARDFSPALAVSGGPCWV